MTFGGMRTVWVLTLFDLPTDSAEARSYYRKFRKHLLDNGFLMLQYSVYARHCPSEENAQVHAQRIRRYLPPDGEVRLLVITDKQFGRMETFFGKIRAPTERPPEQVTLF